MDITVGIATKNRYDCLSHCLLSIALQTLKPLEVIIVDDNDNPIDIREIPVYSYCLRLFDDKGIKWKILFGEKKGQHICHQMVQEAAEGDLIFRIDDDEIAEPETLRKLHSEMKDGVGAVAPSVLAPNPQELPLSLKNIIKNLTLPNTQWFKGEGVREAEHLYSCFLYRKGIIKYDTTLSTVAHREETIFSHSIYRAGYKLLVNHNAKVWHWRQETGGIRTFRDPILWEHDEKIFQGYLKLWGVDKNEKMIILDNGLGDHYAFKHILPELKEKYKNIKIACCFPAVFHDDEDLQLISIAEAKLMFGNIDTYSIYKFMTDKNWTSSLTEAFRALYL